jgi:hypothetical protein
MMRGAHRTLPGLVNFFMVGQWVWPGGGLNTVAMAGRGLVKALCKLDRKPFVTTLASYPPARILPTFGEWPSDAASRVADEVAAATR